MKYILLILTLISCSPRSFIYTDMSALLNNSKGTIVVTAIGYGLEDNCYETIICDSSGNCKTLQGLNYKINVGDTLLIK